jgi:signal transduction histidine kinase
MTDTAARPATHWRLVWIFSLASWLVVWLLMCANTLVYLRERELPIPWTRFGGMFAEYALWGLLSPVALWFMWRHPLSRGNWKASVPYQLAGWVVAAGVFALLLQGVRYGLSLALDEPELYTPLGLVSFSRTYLNAFLAYLDVLLAGHAIHYARDARSKQVRASRLEARLAEAQLDVLRMQLHPHFLFNTLNTISALMHRDLRAADRMLALLGDLLRDSFEKIKAQEVTLKQELGFLEKYLEIEKTRFRDRLIVETAVDPLVLDAEVPNLILQPLVENAIRHGIARRREPGRIRLEAFRDQDRLELRVKDNGPGLPGEGATGSRGGVGLANTQARLRQLYGTAHRFELITPDDGGVEVALSIPLRTLPSPAASEALPVLAATEPAPGPAVTASAVVAR